MDHRHVVGMLLTGPMVVDGEGQHYHMIEGGIMTSTNKDGPGHTHMVEKLKTSGPMPLLDDDSEEDAKKRKKKRKKKSKMPWSY